MSFITLQTFLFLFTSCNQGGGEGSRQERVSRAQNRSSVSGSLNFLTNVDSTPAHIQATVQNIALQFGPIDERWGISAGEVFAQKVSRNVATQSGTWCPLIWRALSLCFPGEAPAELTEAYQNEVNQIPNFSESVTGLSQVPGWCAYGKKVLTHRFTNIPGDSNSFSSPSVREKSDYFSVP